MAISPLEIEEGRRRQPNFPKSLIFVFISLLLIAVSNQLRKVRSPAFSIYFSKPFLTIAHVDIYRYRLLDSNLWMLGENPDSTLPLSKKHFKNYFLRKKPATPAAISYLSFLYLASYSLL